MNRRAFFKSTIAGAGLAAIAATPSILPLVQARHRKHQALVTTPLMKGVGINDSNTLSIAGAALGVGWGYMGFDWAFGNIPTFPYGWVVQLDRTTVPTSAEIAQRVAHPNYANGGRLVMLLNEQDLAYEAMTPANAAALMLQHVNAWHAVDPLARFCVTLGSQLGAPQGGNTSKWGHQLWAALSPTVKQYTVALFSHYYSNITAGEQPTRNFCNNLVSWRNLYAKTTQFPSGVPLWITEYGLSKSGLDLTDPRVADYPFFAVDAMKNNGIVRAAYYGLSDTTISGYVTLCTGNAATLTPTGQMFGKI